MELHHLRCAIAIADHGTFTEAAAALHLSQPTLSYAIGQLERELGARLFERSARQTRLTAAGEAFLGPARSTIDEADRARAAVDAISGVVSGELRIVTIRTAVVETAGYLAAFHRAFPGVRLTVEDPTGDDDVIQLVRSRRCEVGLMRSTACPPDLDSVALQDQDLVVLFPAGTAPVGRTVELIDLAATPIVVPLRGSRPRAALDALLRGAGVEPIVAAECANLEMLFELVRGGVGAAITSNSRAAMLRTDGFAIRQLEPAQLTQLAAVWRATNASPAATAFIRTATTAIRP